MKNAKRDSPRVKAFLILYTGALAGSIATWRSFPLAAFILMGAAWYIITRKEFNQ
jgi:hypothetical protein